MIERSMTSIDTVHTLNLVHGYLRDHITGEFVSRNKIDKLLARRGNIKSIEIVCPLGYKPDRNSLYTRKILRYLTQNLLDINELVLVNGNQAIIDELGFADKQTRIRRLQIKGRNYIKQSNLGSQLPDLNQLICFEGDLSLFEDNRNIQQLFVREDDNSFAGISDLLKRNKGLDKFSIEYLGGDAGDLVAKIEEFGGVRSLLKRMNYFKVLFSDKRETHTFGFNKAQNLLQTTDINLVKVYCAYADFNTFLNLRVLGTISMVEIFELKGRLGDKIDKIDSLYASVAPTAMNQFWQDQQYRMIPTLELQSGTDKLFVNNDKHSLKVFAHSNFVNGFIEGDFRSLEINFYNSPERAKQCAPIILNLENLNELIINKSNTLFLQIIQGYKRETHLLQLQTLKICKEAAMELCSILHFETNDFLENSALRRIDIWNGVPSKVHERYVPIEEQLSEIAVLTSGLNQKWHFELNAERPNAILGVKKRTE